MSLNERVRMSRRSRDVKCPIQDLGRVRGSCQWMERKGVTVVSSVVRDLAVIRVDGARTRWKNGGLGSDCERVSCLMYVDILLSGEPKKVRSSATSVCERSISCLKHLGRNASAQSRQTLVHEARSESCGGREVRSTVVLSIRLSLNMRMSSGGIRKEAEKYVERGRLDPLARDGRHT